MPNAQTPTSPKEQLQELNLPTAVWIGKQDEVLDAIEVISFFKENNPKSSTKIVEGEKHLSILLAVSNPLRSWIHDIVQWTVYNILVVSVCLYSPFDVIIPDLLI